MSFLEIQSLRQDIARSDPGDANQQGELLRRIHVLRDLLQGAAADDLLGYLDAAATLTGYLRDMAGIGPEDIRSMTERLLGSVEEAFSGIRSPMPAQAAPAAGNPPVAHSPVEPATPVAAAARAALHDVQAPLTTAPTPTGGGLKMMGASELPPPPNAGRLRLATELFLGEVLVQLGFCNADQVAEALRVQRATGMRVGEALVNIGATTWSEVQRAVKVQANLRQGNQAHA